MERQSGVFVCLVMLVAMLPIRSLRAGELAEKNFVYQGSLKSDGVPVNDVCDFTFSLYHGDSKLVAQQVFDTEIGTDDPLPVVNGLFQASLNFGEVFESSGLSNGQFSVEVAVRCPAGGAEPLSTLSPRSVIEPAPLAYHALTVEKPDGHSLDAADGSPGNAVYVDEEGFVGMGTASPQSRLHLAANASQVGLKITAAGSWPGELRQTNASFFSLINGGSERLTIEPGGDVGIGTTSPSARLDVVGGNDPQLEIRTSDTLGDDAGIIIQGARNGTTGSDITYLQLRNFDSNEGDEGTEFELARIGAGAETVSGQTGWLRFMTNDGTAVQERMRISAEGNVGVGTSSPDSLLHLSSTGPISLTLSADTDNINESDNARILLSQDGGGISTRLGFASGGNIFEIMQEQANKVHLGVDNRTMLEIGSSTVEVNNIPGNRIISMGQSASEAGVVELYGGGGSLNVLISHFGTDRGVVQIYDENGAAQAGMYVNNNGQGVVFGDLKQFRVENPDQPGTDICYASLEGPEAAAYVRGTGTLVAGRATIVLPDHFQAIASNIGMTVNVTPLSASSMGLAVTSRSTERVEIRELHEGTGNYDFDYMITAVRKGHESFQVIQQTRLNPTTAESPAARTTTVTD